MTRSFLFHGSVWMALLILSLFALVKNDKIVRRNAIKVYFAYNK